MILWQALLAASRSDALRRIVEGWGPARRVAERFVAGDTLEDALTVVRELEVRGAFATLDELGEAVTDEATARRHAGAAVDALEHVGREGLDASVSVKPTALGLDVDTGLCHELTARVCRRAAAAGTHVTLDMEGSAYTQRTVDLVVSLRADGHDNVGCALQVALHRTLDDVRRLTGLGASVRLCKGAYAEPPDIALQDPVDIARAFVRAAEVVLDGDTRGRFATHDHRVIARIAAAARERGVDQDDYELQLLLGVREPLQQRLLTHGHDVRVYVPFGSEWYPYLTRRLAERPANLALLLRALLGPREHAHAAGATRVGEAPAVGGARARCHDERRRPGLPAREVS